MKDSPFVEVPPSDRIASNRSAFAIWDRFPVTPGHALVIPHRMIGSWWEASAEERVDLFDLVEQVRAIIEQGHSPDGYNIGINVGEAAGQTINHLHIHVIPRYAGDMEDPRGGVRHVIPSKGNYLLPDSYPGADEAHLTDGLDGDYLLPQLLTNFANPDFDRIDLVISFIMKSGLGLIADRLDMALQRGANVRILTTDYMQITDPDALTHLLDLVDVHASNIEVKLFHDASVSFHPKAYLFWSSELPDASGYVGSSNLSKSGVAGGVEWNVGLRQVAAMVASFERLWHDTRCIELDHQWLREYRHNRPVSGPRERLTISIEDEPQIQAVAPRPIQEEALAALEETRVDGFEAGLVVMATGLGKTWLAAFDSARPQYRRILFIAHREEILRQSRDVFRQVRPDGDLGFFMGEDKSPDADVVFASIQSLGRHIDKFRPDEFDYVIVDEFHHAAAPSYREAIDHFEPDFLLGLTATPDRRDGADLLMLCGDNLVFDCNLVEGIRRAELSPFEYWGIKDVANFAPIPWRNGRFDPVALTQAVETQDRAAQALFEWREKADAPTLAFCVSITHADFMKDYFNERGVRSASVHSGPTSDPRRESVARLQSGELDVIFSIDIFNEGVDIPEIQTVLMLRPTESPVIFLQQLGRGLRTFEGKTALKVIDFVGNHKSFLMKPRILLSLGSRTPSNAETMRALESGDFDLPPGCSVKFELEAVELLQSMVTVTAADALEEFCRTYESETGIRPTAAQTFQSGYNPASRAVRVAEGWHRYLDGLGLLSNEEVAVVGQLGSVLERFEREPITRAYKLVVFRSLIRLGALTSGVSVDEIAETSLAMIKRDPRLRADIQTYEIPSLDSVSPAAWKRFWLKMPLTYLTNKDDSLYRLRDDRLEPRFSVGEEQAAVFTALAAEIVEWRLLRYLISKSPDVSSSDITLKVSHSKGNPIVRFDRARVAGLPEGETDFVADGRTYRGNFVKIALNVASLQGEQGNALHGLLRGWFGPDAGLPGTNNQIILTNVEGTWVMRKLDPAGSSAENVVHLFPSFAVACGEFAVPSLTPAEAVEVTVLGGSDIDPDRHFVAFAEGDSMAGGTDPVVAGDPLLFGWAQDRSLAEVEGSRVLVEVSEAGQRLATLKRLERAGDGGSWLLVSENPQYPAIVGDSSMRVTAELVRRLSQAELNPLASRVGESFRRADVAPLYGHEFNPGNWNTGHVSLGEDVVLFVTLEKGQLRGVGASYVDHFESESMFVWSSQASVGPDSKKGKEILKVSAEGTRLHLWARRKKSDGAFEYCGLVIPVGHEGERPMSVRFRLLTPLSGDAMRRLGSPAGDVGLFD